MPSDLLELVEAAGAGNTMRPLTQPSDYSRGGLAMNATRRCTECGERAVARGLCNPHYKIADRKGELPPRLDPQVERMRKFWANVDKTDTCWQWIGSLESHGYGQFGHGIRGLTSRAHKLSWEWENGPVPDGLVLDHLCRNRACVRPEHLEPVTPRVNALRGIGPSAVNSRKSKCDNGHPYPAGRRSCPTCQTASNRRGLRRQLEKRAAVVCGADTTKGGHCKNKIAKGKRCKDHPTVLWQPEVGA